MEDINVGLVIGVIAGLLFGMLIWSIIEDISEGKEIEQLGQSICEEEYGMDFESYIDNTLRCKPFTEEYDGIKVEVPKEVD